MKNNQNRLTTFNISTSHVIQTSFLFPIVWLIVGSFVKMILNDKGFIPLEILSLVYYLIMLISFYLGIKYSLAYINKKIIVSQPQNTAKQSILWFLFGAVSINYAFYYFEESLNFIRIITTVLIIVMFIKLTTKYFNSIEADNEYIEYSLPLQIVIFLANLSLIIMLFITYGIYHESIWIHLLITPFLIALIVFLQDKIDIFVPFFYKKNEIPNFKKPYIVLAITLPINIILIQIIIKYFQNT